jgi:hypothetical protein
MSWYVARSLDQLLAEINALAPNRNKASDGSIGDAAHSSRDSDHNPCDCHDAVCARDFTHDPAGGFDSYHFAHWLVDRCARGLERRGKYVISNGMIASASKGWTWRTYTGSNPHSHHVHVSVEHPSTLFDDPGPWSWSTNAPIPPPTTDGEFVMDAEAKKAFDALEKKIDSVGSALNKHIEQEEATQSRVDSVGTALNKHITQLDEHDQDMKTLLS